MAEVEDQQQGVVANLITCTTWLQLVHKVPLAFGEETGVVHRLMPFCKFSDQTATDNIKLSGGDSSACPLPAHAQKGSGYCT